MIEQTIQSLINKRTIQAAGKELSKKMYAVIKAFGRPIIEQSVTYTDLPDFWDLESFEIQEIDGDVNLKGYYFDGLSRGLNFTIKLLIYDNQPTSLEAKWNGYQVFNETEGQLKGYVPHKDWEDALERLYTYAKPVAQEKAKEESMAEKEVKRKKAMGVLQQLKMLWGFQIGD